MPKKWGHDAYPLSHELQIETVNSKTWTVRSKFEPWAPILNRELQLSTVSSNYQPWAPPELLQNSQKPPNCIELSKMSRDNVEIDYLFFIIYYFILYLFYFYYILFYIICILFLLYIILYYMYFIFIICYFILYVLP